MPKLPEITAVRQTPRARISVVSDRSGEIEAAAIQDVGHAVSRFGAEMAERDDAFRYGHAQAMLLRADIEARKELETDQDYESHESRYQDRMKKAHEAASGLIRGNQDRALFQERAMLDIERGAGEVRNRARTIEVDQAMADLSAVLQSNRSAALEASDAPTRTSIINNSIDMITAARTQYGDRFTATDAETMRQRWTHDYAEGFVTVQPAEQRIAMLKNPKGTPAAFLDADERATMLKSAQAEHHERELRGASIEQADAIMDTHSDRGDALAAARKIEDPEVRDATTARVNARFNEIDTIKAERNDKAFTAAATNVETTGHIDGIDARTWTEVLTQPQRQALEQRAQQIQTGVEPTTDQALWYEIRMQAVNDSPAFKARNLMLDRPMLNNSDFQSFADLQARMEVAGANAIDDMLAGVRNSTQVVDDTLRSIGLNPSPKDGTDEATAVAKFNHEVDIRVRTLQIQTGKKATTDDVQTIVDGMIVKGYVPDKLLWVIPWFQEPRRAFEVGPDEVFTVVDIKEVPPKDRAEIENALQRAGRAVTNSSVLTLYNLGLQAP